MNNTNDKLVPELRFPEFVNEGEWEVNPLSNFSSIIVEKAGVKKYKLLSITTGIGLVSQMEKFGREIAGESYKNYYVIKKDDFAYNKSSVKIHPEGQIALLEKEESGAVPNSIFTCFRVNTNIILPSFLKYPFENNVHGKWLRNFIAIGARANGALNVDNKDLLSLHIPYPSLFEQKKIADCLSSLDDLITAHTNKLESLKQYKKGLLQNLFPQDGEAVPKLRFKEFEKDGEWEEKNLIETTNKKVKWSFTGGPFGSNLKASDYTAEGFRIIQLQNIGDGEFNDSYKIYTSEEKANELLSSNIYSGEIIISKMGDPVGRACIIPDNITRCVMASDGIRLVVDEEKYSKYFIYSLINSKRIRQTIEKKATGSTRKRIGLDDLKGIKLLIPKEIKEQKKIAVLLSSVDDLIQAESDKIEQLKQHKKGLMQRLFPIIEP